MEKKIDRQGITSYSTGQDISASQRKSNLNEAWNFPFIFYNSYVYWRENGGKSDHHAWFWRAACLCVSDIGAIIRDCFDFAEMWPLKL